MRIPDGLLHPVDWMDEADEGPQFAARCACMIVYLVAVGIVCCGLIMLMIFLVVTSALDPRLDGVPVHGLRLRRRRHGHGLAAGVQTDLPLRQHALSDLP